MNRPDREAIAATCLDRLKWIQLMTELGALSTEHEGVVFTKWASADSGQSRLIYERNDGGPLHLVGHMGHWLPIREGEPEYWVWFEDEPESTGYGFARIYEAEDFVEAVALASAQVPA